MKRFLTLLFTCALLCAALCVTAGASDYDSVAQELAGIGMFRGTASGFELDRAPKRSEAAIMLVRLYGAEEEANAQYAAGEITHPFTDVSDFTAPYVAWLYTKGITNGTSATTFSAQNPCTKQNYLVFLLRALGYQDGADFTYADAEEFAEECGFYEPSYFEGEFLRDDLAALTEQALAANVKGGDQTLLAALVDGGGIDADAAKPLMDKIDTYRAMVSASSMKDVSAVDADISMAMLASADGESSDAQFLINLRVDTAGRSPKYAVTTALTADDETFQSSTWYKDGWVYKELISGDIPPVRYKIQNEQKAETLQDAARQQIAFSSLDMKTFAMLHDISTEPSGSDTVYTATYQMARVNGLVESMLGQLGAGDGTGVRIGEVTAHYTVDAKGLLKAVDMQFTAVMRIPVQTDEGTTVHEATCAYEVELVINAVGSGVKIDYPDLSKFEELDVIDVEF